MCSLQADISNKSSRLRSESDLVSVINNDCHFMGGIAQCYTKTKKPVTSPAPQISHLLELGPQIQSWARPS